MVTKTIWRHEITYELLSVNYADCWIVGIPKSLQASFIKNLSPSELRLTIYNV